MKDIIKFEPTYMVPGGNTPPELKEDIKKAALDEAAAVVGKHYERLKACGCIIYLRRNFEGTSFMPRVDCEKKGAACNQLAAEIMEAFLSKPPSH